MKVIFYGKNSKLNERKFERAIKFFLSLLMKKKQYKDLTLHISFRKKDKMLGAYGYVEWIKPQTYHIWIDKSADDSKQIETLAHELVHVKQFVNREVHYKTLEPMSKGLKAMCTDSSSYWDHPMEIEAFGRTPGMVHRFYTE